MENEPLNEEDEKSNEPIIIQGSGMTGPLFFAIFVCAMGSSFQFGYNTGVVNNAEIAVKHWLNESEFESTGDWMNHDSQTFLWSIIVSILSIGGMFGGLVSGTIADKFGRKGGMMINNIIGLVAVTLVQLSKMTYNYYILIIARFVFGINAGLNSAFAPMYLTEISPVNLRGAIGTTHQLVTCLSVLISQIFGLKFIFGNYQLWHILFEIIGVASIFQLICLPFCPESPKYNLIVKNRDKQVEKDLKKLRGKVDVTVEMNAMREEADEMKITRKVTCSSLCTDPALRWPLSIALMMMLSQQLSGINVAVYYSSNIFRSAGLSQDGATYATLGMGTLNLIVTTLSLFLMEKFGRRPLHLSGLGGMWFTSILLVIFLTLKHNGHDWAGIFTIISTMAFTGSFSVGPGSIPWFFVSELFLVNSRGYANSIAVMTNWLGNFTVGLIFLPLKDSIGQYSMLLFTMFITVFWIYTFVFVPETKGVPIATIVQKFKEGTRRKF